MIAAVFLPFCSIKAGVGIACFSEHWCLFQFFSMRRESLLGEKVQHSASFFHHSTFFVQPHRAFKVLNLSTFLEKWQFQSAVDRCGVLLFQRVADWSELADGGEAGVGRLCVPEAVQYVHQKLS